MKTPSMVQYETFDKLNLPLRLSDRWAEPEDVVELDCGEPLPSA